METTILYFSATGNSLYAARILQQALPSTALISIPTALRQKKFSVDSERIGLIFPLHYGGLPILVEEYVRQLSMPNVKYLFAISTCGVPYLGRPFSDLNELLNGRKLDAAWFLRLVSNYLMLRDTAADWRIKIRYWLADRKLGKIARMIADDQRHETWELRKDWCRRMHDDWEARRSTLDEKFIVDESKCVRCGLYCVQLVLPDQLSKGAGTILFTGGLFGVHPNYNSDYADMSIGKAALRALAYMLNDELKNSGVYAGIVDIMGIVDGNEHFAAEKIAEAYWALHVERDRVEYIFD